MLRLWDYWKRSRTNPKQAHKSMAQNVLANRSTECATWYAVSTTEACLDSWVTGKDEVVWFEWGPRGEFVTVQGLAKCASHSPISTKLSSTVSSSSSPGLEVFTYSWHSQHHLELLSVHHGVATGAQPNQGLRLMMSVSLCSLLAVKKLCYRGQ